MKPRPARRDISWSATTTAARSMPWTGGCCGCAGSTEVEPVGVHFLQGAKRLEVGQAVVPRPNYRKKPVMRAEALQLLVRMAHQQRIRPASAPEPLVRRCVRPVAREHGGELEHELALDARESNEIASRGHGQRKRARSAAQDFSSPSALLNARIAASSESTYSFGE